MENSFNVTLEHSYVSGENYSDIGAVLMMMVMNIKTM